MKYLIFLFFLPLPFACTQPGSAQSEQANAQLPPTKVGAEVPIAPAPVDTVQVAVATDTVPTKPKAKPAPEFSVEYLMGQFDPAQHPDFVSVDKKYADGEGISFGKKPTRASQKCGKPPRPTASH